MVGGVGVTLHGLHPSKLVVWNPLCLDPSGDVCAWSFPPSRPLRYPHIECLFCFNSAALQDVFAAVQHPQKA